MKNDVLIYAFLMDLWHSLWRSYLCELTQVKTPRDDTWVESWAMSWENVRYKNPVKIADCYNFWQLVSQHSSISKLKISSKLQCFIICFLFFLKQVKYSTLLFLNMIVKLIFWNLHFDREKKKRKKTFKTFPDDTCLKLKHLSALKLIQSLRKAFYHIVKLIACWYHTYFYALRQLTTW